LAAVLLVVLWVRSYSVVDRTRAPTLNGSALIISGHGRVGVYWSHYKNHGLNEVWSSSLLVPFWFLVSAAALFAAVPWIEWPKRFTLRTLLIAMTLVAVVLGLIVAVA
jgi:hypothetical protein